MTCGVSESSASEDGRGMERQKTATKKAGKTEDDDLFFHVVFILCNIKNDRMMVAFTGNCQKDDQTLD